MKTFLIASVLLYLLICFIARYDKIRNIFIHQWYRVTIHKYSTSGRFIIHSTVVNGGKLSARQIGQELVKAMEGYEKGILTYDITKENI